MHMAVLLLLPVAQALRIAGCGTAPSLLLRDDELPRGEHLVLGQRQTVLFRAPCRLGR